MASTSVNPTAVGACRAAFDRQAQDIDNLVAGPVPAIGGDFLGGSDDAVRLARTVRGFDRTVFGQLIRAAGLIRASGAAAGSDAEMFQDFDHINARSVGRYEPA